MFVLICWKYNVSHLGSCVFTSRTLNYVGILGFTSKHGGYIIWPVRLSTVCPNLVCDESWHTEINNIQDVRFTSFWKSSVDLWQVCSPVIQTIDRPPLPIASLDACRQFSAAQWESGSLWIHLTCQRDQPWILFSFMYSPIGGQINASRLITVESRSLNRLMNDNTTISHTHIHGWWVIVKHEVQSRSHIHSREHIAHVYLTLLSHTHTQTHTLTHMHSKSHCGPLQ